jgi:hypothetical protein
MPKLDYIKLGTYIVVLKPISAAYFINPSDKSVYLYVYPLITARQRLLLYDDREKEHALVGNGRLSHQQYPGYFKATAR